MTERDLFLSFDQQVARLKEKYGLIVADADAAAECLSQVNYSHLKGYHAALMDSGSGRFAEGTTFRDLWGLHESDRDMRVALWRPLETIEKKARCAIAYVLGKNHGPFDYLEPSCYRSFYGTLIYHDDFVKRLTFIFEHSKEPFLDPYQGRDITALPVWFAVELLSFSDVSKLVKRMLERDAGEVAAMLRLPISRKAANFLHTTSDVRNICAHHGRLYARNLATECLSLHEDDELVGRLEPGWILPPRSLFAALLAIRAMIPENERLQLAARIAKILEANPLYRPCHIGFPSRWREILETEPLQNRRRALRR